MINVLCATDTHAARRSFQHEWHIREIELQNTRDQAHWKCSVSRYCDCLNILIKWYSFHHAHSPCFGCLLLSTFMNTYSAGNVLGCECVFGYTSYTGWSKLKLNSEKMRKHEKRFISWDWPAATGIRSKAPVFNWSSECSCDKCGIIPTRRPMASAQSLTAIACELATACSMADE